MAHLAEAEDARDHQERMLHFRPHLRLGPVSGLVIIALHAGLLHLRKVWLQLAVMYIRRRGNDRMNQLGPAVDAYVCLHAEVPLIPFLGLVHLGIALLALVFDRAGRADNRCIRDGAGADLHALSLMIRRVWGDLPTG